MKYAFAPLGLMALALAGCGEVSAGNPDGEPYLGSIGSAYEIAHNPPQTIGAVAYDPNSPQKPPADDAVVGTSGDDMHLSAINGSRPTRLPGSSGTPADGTR